VGATKEGAGNQRAQFICSTACREEQQTGKLAAATLYAIIEMDYKGTAINQIRDCLTSSSG